MRRTSLVVILVLVAGCAAPVQSGDTAVTEATTTTSSTTTTTTPVEATRLSYALEPGISFTYEVDIDQTIDMTATGDPQAMGEEDVPGEMSLHMTGVATLTHAVAEGPESGTFEVTITGDYSGLQVDGVIDGEPVDEEGVPPFADLEPIDVTVVVDEQGNIIPEDGMDGGMLGELGGLGGFEGLAQLGGNGALGQFLGPALPDEEVTVGDSWTETLEVPTLPEDDPITTVVESRVVAAEEVEGHPVLVIETTTTTSPIEFDLAELLLGFMFAFAPEGSTEEELAEFEAMAGQLRFALSVDETTSDMTSWFDPAAGLTRRGEVATDTHMLFDVNFPDEATGELVAFNMEMQMSVAHDYRLIGVETA